MTTYIYSVTSELQENANASQWARAGRRTLIGQTHTRRRNALARADAANDVLILAGHGSETAIGTHESDGRFATSLSVANVRALLMDEMQIPNGMRVYLACCNSDVFAASLQTAITTYRPSGVANPTHPNVTCDGQEGDFRFPTDVEDGL